MIADYFEKFKPDVLVGLPTLLIDLAESLARNKKKIKIRQIYYAGEKMPIYAPQLFKKVFCCDQIRSAGYASVDAGPIGYQCTHSKLGEHHLFSDFVHLEVVNSEAVVTAKYREIMPIIRLKTGDRVELISGHCSCGASDQKFMLQGRTDNQINIWGCRLPLLDIEKSLAKIFGFSFQYQIHLTENQGKEKLTILIESDSKKKLTAFSKKRLWNSLKDLRLTHPFEYFDKRCDFNLVKSIERVGRTGKIKKIKDDRI